MPPLSYVLLLSVLSLPPAVLILQCNKTQYPWPRLRHTLCCEPCPPGTRLEWRSESSCEKICEPCIRGQFADSSNVERSCSFCKRCREDHMEIQSKCTSTQNAVCRCSAGYDCNDKDCTKCVKKRISITQLPLTVKPKIPLPPFVTPMLPPATTVSLKPAAPTTRVTSPSPRTDKMLLLVVFLFLISVVAVVFFLQHFKNKLGSYLVKKPTPVLEDEEVSVSKPIQECEK